MLRKLSVMTFLLCVSAHDVLAAGGGGHGDGHSEASGGLPQLDATTYPSQIFWMIVVFVIMHFFFAKKSLPEISRTIENRSERVSNDLDSAERLKEEVEAVQKSYEDSLSGAREESSRLFSDIENEIKIKSEKHASDFQERLNERIQVLEKEIVKARKNAMDEMSDVAADVAMTAAEKIIGVKANKATAKAVVEAINKAA